MIYIINKIKIPMKKNNYYVYILFKTYHTGKFIYDDLEFHMEPFYIGKGCGNRLEISKREINSSNRHKSRIIEKITRNNMTVTSIKYRYNLSESQALNLETQLIKKIGRKDLGLGPLSNLCDGGKGSIGEIPGKWKEVYKYSIDGIFLEKYDSIKDAAKKNGIHQANIGNVCRGKRDTCGGFIWKFFYSDKLESSEIKKINNRTQKGNFKVSILQYDLEYNILNSYNSIKECSEKTGCHPSKIVLVCQNKRKQTGGFIFKYEKH